MRLPLSLLTITMLGACAAPQVETRDQRLARLGQEEQQRLAYIRPYCTPDYSDIDERKECTKAMDRWTQAGTAKLHAEMQAEHQHGALYYVLGYTLGPLVGAPPPDLPGDTMRYDGYARTMSYRDHDDYVSPLSW